MTFDKLYKMILDRKQHMPENSYVASLFRLGFDRIVQKFGEESVEVIISTKNKNRQEIIYEMADVWFHSLVLLSACDIKPEDVLRELKKRMYLKKESATINEEKVL